MIGIIDTDDLERLIDGALEKRLRGARKRSVLTLQQLAGEWQCSRQGIMNWVRREHNPLPVHYLGNEPRFHREEFDAWSKAEADRKLAKVAEMALGK